MCFLPHLSSLLACPQPRHLTSRLSFLHLSSCHLSHLINLSCLATSSRSLSVSLADVGIASVALGVMRNCPQRPYFDATGTNDRSHAVGSYVDALSRRPTRAPVLPFRSFAYDPPRSPLTVEISSSILDLALPLLSESVLTPPPPRHQSKPRLPLPLLPTRRHLDNRLESCKTNGLSLEISLAPASSTLSLLSCASIRSHAGTSSRAVPGPSRIHTSLRCLVDTCISYTTSTV